MYRQSTMEIRTAGRGAVELTERLAGVVRDAGVRTGLAHLFVQHTSASLLLCENADPDVRRDLETLFARLAPDGDAAYRHDSEGADDMAAHARTVLTASSLSIPVAEGRLLLGTWQGVYLWEHRRSPHTRRVTVTVHGEG